MRRVIVVPAVFVGCLVVIWVGTVAAANMPSQELLAPTQTALAEAAQSGASESVKTDNRGIQSAGCSLSASFPAEIRQWCGLIETAASASGLPANLIAAVILQESGGDPSAYSSSGAVGLMQVMPRDGLAADFMCINGPCFANRPTIAELEDPNFNIQYGSGYLASLVQRHGTIREALFKYGPIDVGYTYADLVLKIYENYQ